MKYLLSAILLTILSTLTVKVQAKEDSGNINHFSISGSGLGLVRDTNLARSFEVGESNADRDSRLAREQEERSASLRNARSTRRFIQTIANVSSTPYPYGWCTWYAAQRKGINTNFGDAKKWPVNSQEPQVGAVMVTYESWRGHVAYVTNVDGYNITVDEMNYAGWGKVSTRTVDYRKLPLKGFLI